ncbi:hypothetical protein U0027_04475 [Agrobacterium tumefaciens]|uniref:hypothetical protein n=1 Tax=Agrobacterium tumefaciens TaxID=358 RepID=UPI0013B40DD0|nr:hypothetical protein [Agrobacterium tumefaciens]WQE40778.1 hypothetical protein U0027_04475 [Agrobacterium tumefaciens]
MARRRGKPVSAHLRGNRGLAAGGGPPEEGKFSTDRTWTVDRIAEKLDVSVFSHVPAFVAPCAEFLHERGMNSRPATRSGYFKHLRYFSTYIAAYGSSFGIRVSDYSDVTTNFIEGFLKWLHGRGDVRPRVGSAGSLAGITAADVYNLVKDLLSSVSASETFGHLITQPIVFKTNPSEGAYRKIKPRPGLSRASLLAIRSACIKELTETSEKLRRGRMWLDDETIAVPDQQSDPIAFKPLEVCVKAYRATEPKTLNDEQFTAKYPSLERAMRPPYNQKSDILEHIHFTKRTIVPVVLLLDMHFAFEPDGMVQLDWEREKDSFLFGASRGIVGTEKFRGGYSTPSKPYARNEKRPFSPAALFELLRLITPDTAKFISPSCTRIFCFARRDGSYGYFRDSCDFRGALNRFIKDHKLEHFTLSAFRKTGADTIGKISGGDIAEQKLFLGHKTIATTARHYQSESNISLRAEQLGHAVNIRVRRIRTENKVETRGAALSPGQRLAATIGFYCLDAYDSPLSGQVKGQLCQAYGQCPACPLAQIDKSSARDCKRLHQVRERLEEARRVADPSRWIAYFGPQLDALEKIWLPAFDQAAKIEAMQLYLPAIPEIE